MINEGAKALGEETAFLKSQSWKEAEQLLPLKEL